MKKKMRVRTKFTILSAIMEFITLPVQIFLSYMGKEMLSDGFLTGWTAFWAVEILCCYGLKVNSKGE